MNIIQFLKLLKKNIIIIIMVPAILGGLVWHSTKNETRNYSSETIIYAGVGSGLSLESQSSSRLDFFGSKMEFDNITNLFKARQTHEEVALRLLTQGLSLETWDPQYISRKSFNKLHESVPQYIKDLVVKKGMNSRIKAVHTPLVLNDTSRLKNKRIYCEDEWHTVKTGESLFFISDLYTTPVSDLMNWNQITSTKLIPGSKMIIRKTERVIGITENGLNDTLNLFIPDSTFFVKANIDSTAFEETVEIFREYASANDTNYIYKMLNYGHPFYSIKAISKIRPKRVQGSDLIKVSFKSTDPGICKQTLMFTIYSFEKNYRKLKENQSDHIVAYFEQRVRESTANLQASENKLLRFNQDNNIINYYEQTRHISDQKEQLDSRYYDEKMTSVATHSVISNLELQLEEQVGLAKLNTSLLEYRDRLAKITYKIAINELNDSKDPEVIAAIEELGQESEDIKENIKNDVGHLYNIKFSPEGVNTNDILSMWLMKIIEYEESKARLSALYDRKKEFQRTYETFAPLGAKLSKIEREIDVFEQQYLSLLHSLNQAKLKQQNLELKSSIKTVDPPYFPLSPEGSTRKLLIVASVIVGLVLTLFIILLLEYFDDTIKTPERAVLLTTLKLISAFPRKVAKTKGINYPFIRKRLMEITILNMRSFLKDINKENKKGPTLVLFFSTSITEGKSYIQENLADSLRLVNSKVLSINYNIPTYSPRYVHIPKQDEDYIQFEVKDSFFNIKNLEDLFEGSIPLDVNSYDFILLELPSIVEHPFPPELIKKADFGIMVVRANRTWQKADVNALESIRKFMNFEPVVLLNGANPEYLQDIIGELPRNRSRIRRVLKKLVRLQVFERHQLKE